MLQIREICITEGYYFLRENGEKTNTIKLKKKLVKGSSEEVRQR
jgi:hypothetical protein